MADVDNANFVVGAAPRNMQRIDQVPWGRAAQDFVGVEEHEKLAERLGAAAAAEVLLLIMSRQRGTDKDKWQ